jgi:uncharacterized protein with PIN domain
MMAPKGRTECPECNGSLRYEGRRQMRTNGHHLSVFTCGNCGREVLAG